MKHRGCRIVGQEQHSRQIQNQDGLHPVVREPLAKFIANDVIYARREAGTAGEELSHSPPSFAADFCRAGWGRKLHVLKVCRRHGHFWAGRFRAFEAATAFVSSSRHRALNAQWFQVLPSVFCSPLSGNYKRSFGTWQRLPRAAILSGGRQRETGPRRICITITPQRLFYFKFFLFFAYVLAVSILLRSPYFAIWFSTFIHLVLLSFDILIFYCRQIGTQSSRAPLSQHLQEYGGQICTAGGGPPQKQRIQTVFMQVTPFLISLLTYMSTQFLCGH